MTETFENQSDLGALILFGTVNEVINGVRIPRRHLFRFTRTTEGLIHAKSQENDCGFYFPANVGVERGEFYPDRALCFEFCQQVSPDPYIRAWSRTEATRRPRRP